MAQEDYLSDFFLAYISYISSCLTGVLVAVPSYPFEAIGHPVGVDSPRISQSPSPSIIGVVSRCAPWTLDWRSLSI